MKQPKKGCDAIEQVIHTHIYSTTQEPNHGLGDFPFIDITPANKPSLNINTIAKDSSKKIVTLVHPKLIDILLNVYKVENIFTYKNK